MFGIRLSILHCRLIVLGLLAVGCATLPEDFTKTASAAVAEFDDTTLGRLFAADTQSHPGQSGFALVADSRNAFRNRIAMIRLAEKSVDVQYYIWDADRSGGTMALELLAAADRGVRVRALIDDSSQTGRDNALLAYDAHPNIEVRIFNPFANRGSRAWGYLTDLQRLNHRMHNKLIVADNSVALVGGRNIADHYFGANEEENFRDLDMAAVGPIVRDLSSTFDVFWNSSWAYPIAAFDSRESGEVNQGALADHAADVRARLFAYPYPFPLDTDVANITGEVTALPDKFIWATGRVLFDDPDELTQNNRTTGAITALREQLGSVDAELLIEAAYFVPREGGVETLGQIVDRGARVRVLTNSLASNDVAAAHAGYEKYRRQLLERGIELYELRPDSEEIRDDWAVLAGNSRSLLHTKALVWDADTLFVGSLNLDPRSTDINTEMGLVVYSEALAQTVRDYMNEGASLANAYRVELDADGDLQWVTQTPDGELLTLSKEPQTSLFKRGTADFIKTLPVESQL